MTGFFLPDTPNLFVTGKVKITVFRWLWFSLVSLCIHLSFPTRQATELMFVLFFLRSRVLNKITVQYARAYFMLHVSVWVALVRGLS